MHLVRAVFAAWLAVGSMNLFADEAGAMKVTVADIPASATLIDVRSQQEWQAGHAQQALHLPVDEVQEQAPMLLPDQDTEIVTYCRSGGRAQRAADMLRSMGYQNVRSLIGGYADLKEAGLPVSEPQ